MALQNSLYERLGKTEFPFEATDVSGTILTFEPLDPGKSVLLAVLKAAINYELSAAWTKVTNSLPTGHFLRSTSPVEDAISREPDLVVLQQTKRTFPLLALHRTGEATFERFSVDRTRSEQEWALHYILGPLDDGAWVKLQEVLLGVSDIVRLTISRRGHLAYSSYSVLTNQTSGFATVEHLKSEAGSAKIEGSDKLFYGMLMTLRTVEVSELIAEAFAEGGGGTVTAGVGSDGGGILPEVVVGDTDYPPQ